MKILQVAPYFPPYVGGQERFIHNLSRKLVERGHEVVVVTSDFPLERGRSTVDGVEVIRVRCLARPLRNPIAPGLPTVMWQFRHFDVLHAHNEHSFGSNVSCLIRRLAGTPLVLTCHGRLLFDSPAIDLLRLGYWHSVGKLTLRTADRITAATPSEANRLVTNLHIDRGKVDVVPVGIDIARWKNILPSRPRATLPDDLRDKRVVAVATQLIRRKGINHLIRAMPMVITRHPDAVLLIAGEGDQRKDLELLIGQLGLDGHVRVLGHLGDSELAWLYARADAFVLPSLSEGQPTCVMEAWLHNTPVIATRIEGVSDYFDKCALLVEPGDAEGLGGAICRVLQDSALARTLAEMGRSLMLSRFSWEGVADLMLETYRKAVEERRPVQPSEGRAVVR